MGEVEVGEGVLCVKQKTAYEMRISDWSSDVCASDLPGFQRLDGRILAIDVVAEFRPRHRLAHRRRRLRHGIAAQVDAPVRGGRVIGGGARSEERRVGK